MNAIPWWCGERASMDFMTLSLPEATYVYMGLAIQRLLRSSSLLRLAPIMLTLWSLVLLTRAGRQRGGYGTLMGYVCAHFVILALFWPEATVFARRLTQTVDVSQVGSYAASQDPNAEVVTAQDTGQ